MAFVFRDHCLPIPTTTAAVSETTTVVNDVTTGGHRPSNDYESVVREGQGRSAGSFSLGRIINFILFVNMNLTALNRPLYARANNDFLSYPKEVTRVLRMKSFIRYILTFE